MHLDRDYIQLCYSLANIFPKYFMIASIICNHNRLRNLIKFIIYLLGCKKLSNRNLLELLNCKKNLRTSNFKLNISKRLSSKIVVSRKLFLPVNYKP